MIPGPKPALGWLCGGGALVSALLLILALPPFGILPLGFVALTPLAICLALLPPDSSGRYRAALLALVFGVLFWGFQLVWVPLVVGPHFSWAYPGYLLQVALLGGLAGVFGWVAHHLHRERSLPLGLALPLAWVGVEWIKAHFPFGLSFPWLGLGVTLTDWPQLLTPAEWVGEEGVAFWLAGVNGMAASAVVGTRSGHGVGRWLLVGGAILVPSVLGLVRARSLQLDPGPTVMVIGTHVSPALRARPEDAGRETLRQIEDALGQTDPGSVDILALPEATIPFPLQAVQARPSMEALESLVDRLRVPVVFGALGRGVGGGRDTAVTNSAYLLSPGGSRIQRYDKRQLVPGMEAGAYEKGRGPGILEAGEWNLGLLVCYESLFSGSAREARRAGADLLVNLSSDIWFGQEGSFLGSLFLHQHPEHLVLRAVENRMPVARAANGGFSLLLDPLGRAASETVSPGGGATQAKVPVFRGRTLFSVIGDWVGPGSLLFGLFVLLGRWRKAGAGGPSKAR